MKDNTKKDNTMKATQTMKDNTMNHDNTIHPILPKAASLTVNARRLATYFVDLFNDELEKMNGAAIGLELRASYKERYFIAVFASKMPRAKAEDAKKRIALKREVRKLLDRIADKYDLAPVDRRSFKFETDTDAVAIYDSTIWTLEKLMA